MASVSSCIVGSITRSGMFSGRHWSKPSAMFGSNLGDLALRRVWNHRTHRSRMMSSTSLKDAVHVFDVCRAAVSLPFQVHRLKVLVEADPVAFSSACFEFTDEVPKLKISSVRQPCAPSEVFFQPSSRPFEGCCCGVLGVGASSINTYNQLMFLQITSILTDFFFCSLFPVQQTTRSGIGNQYAESKKQD